MPSVILVPDDQPTITAAIAAADPFDTIRVAAGVYNESVVVNKPVQLLGAQAGVDARTRPGTASTESIISIDNVSGIVQVTDERVVIDGFTIQDNTLGPGITTSAADSGYWIFNNIIRNNVFGIYLLSSGTLVTQVRHNFFQNNNQSGAGNGNAVFSESGSSFWIDENLFSGHVTASVNLSPVAPTQSNSIISNNTMISDNSIALTNTSNVKIANNVLTNSQGSAIFFGGNTSNTDIEGNVIQNGVSNGIRITTTFVATPNTNIRIKNNNISGNAVAGLNVALGAYDDDPPNLQLDATNNWWGSATGPFPIGTGDAVIDPNAAVVDIAVPFLTQPAGTFQVPQSVLTTGPIMVASSPIKTAAVIVLNDDTVSEADITITVFNLSTGVKTQITQTSQTLQPQRASYQEFSVSATSIYEIVVNVSGTNQVAVSVWNLDASKIQVTAQHLVASEMYFLERSFPVID
ncbi:right-handed parallel beta-helix repeat-containing protein [Brevibacillus sp. SYSU BS000544]|uniref:right-handed parallel beta-helix repeat-containing protein n=1 Tax=Brevibacillus sp. SYSU BS000544 TaxID=3416443 RepID=UPI003CE5C79D